MIVDLTTDEIADWILEDDYEPERKEEKSMTLLELQAKLGKQIEDITDERIPFVNRKQMAEIATVVSSLAKQMINNADVVLRAEKLFSDTKLKNSAVMDMVSGKYLLMRKGNDGELTGKTL